MKWLTSLLFALGAVLTQACLDRETRQVCPLPIQVLRFESWGGCGFAGLDLLVVVDNSESMLEEQQILAGAFFTTINSLVTPLPTWQVEGLDNVRVAVVTSDMGLQYGTQGALPDYSQQEVTQCIGLGDNGELQNYGSGKSIDIQDMTIQCDYSASQCPTGWNCVGLDTNGVGPCVIN